MVPVALVLRMSIASFKNNCAEDTIEDSTQRTIKSKAIFTVTLHQETEQSRRNDGSSRLGAERIERLGHIPRFQVSPP
jgi:hypothetical protein